MLFRSPLVFRFGISIQMSGLLHQLISLNGGNVQDPKFDEEAHQDDTQSWVALTETTIEIDGMAQE